MGEREKERARWQRLLQESTRIASVSPSSSLVFPDKADECDEEDTSISLVTWSVAAPIHEVKVRSG